MLVTSARSAGAMVLIVAALSLIAGCKKSETAETAAPAVTAESLGLPAGTKSVGADPLGRYWFKLPAASKSEASSTTRRKWSNTG